VTSVRVLNKLLGLNISAKKSERNISNLGCLSDEFYAHLSVVKESEAVYFNASFDEKGVHRQKKKGMAWSRKGLLGKCKM
jgi:hypothetical protein